MEIAIEYDLGKLPLPEPPEVYVPGRLLASGVTGLPVEHRHALAVGRLERHHRDPFDRLLIAQSLIESLPIVTADRHFSHYEIETVRA